MSFNISELFGPKSASLMGLDITSFAVKMVELSAVGKGGYRVDRYVVEMLPKDVVSDGNINNVDAVVDGIRRAMKRMETSTRQVAMALPTSAVITKRVIVPGGLREEELGAQIESVASQYIPFAIEEVSLDYREIGPAPDVPGEIEVFIAASKRDRVEERVAIAEAADLKAQIIDVESLAEFASYELICGQMSGGGRGQVNALVDVGATTVRLTVLRDGVQLFTRDQSFGGNRLTQEICRHYGVSFEEANSAKRSGSLPVGYESDVLAPFMENLSQEISRVLQFLYTSTQFNAVDQIILSGGCAALPGIGDVVAMRTKTDVMIANPFVGMSLSDKVRPRELQQDAPLLMAACGLALRRFDSL